VHVNPADGGRDSHVLLVPHPKPSAHGLVVWADGSHVEPGSSWATQLKLEVHADPGGQ